MMKKLLLFLVTFVFAIGASGQHVSKDPRLSGQQVKGKYEFRTTHQSHERSGRLPMMSQSRKAPARVDIIRDQPEGELKTYQRSGGAMYSFWGYLFTTYQDGGAMQMVFADDGKTVYLKDPVSQAVSGTWVRAELSDDGKTLTMPLNQHVAYYDDVEYGLITAWVNVGADESGTITATPDLDIQEVTFTIGEDGTISMNGSSGDVNTFECSGLGLIYDDDFTWTTYLDWESVYTPFDATPVQLPDDAVLEDFSMSYVDSEGNPGGKMVKVAIMEPDVYVQGFSDIVPDGVMKGSMDKSGLRVMFESDQYLGVGNSMFMNMMGVDDEYTTLNYLNFDFDAETRTMTANDILAVVAGMNIQEEYGQPVIAPYFDRAATPANPEVIDFVDEGALDGYNYGTFNVPTVDTEGNFINTNDLYYRIYFDDDELFTFGPDEYPYVEDFMSDIPYNYTDGYDISRDGTALYIYFYETGFQRVGIQSVFRGGGEEHVSDIVYMDLTDGSAPEGSAETYAGYCDDHASKAGLSAGRAQGYDLATYIYDPSLKGLKVKGLRITAPSGTAVTQYTGWLSNGLSLAMVDGVKVAVADIASKAGDVVSGHAEVMFDEPYEIGEEGFFAGYTIPVTDEEEPLMVTSDKLGGGLWMHTTSALRSWTDLSSAGSPCIELILEGQPTNAATIIVPANSFAKKGEPIQVNAKVYNHGTDMLSTYSYTYEVNGVTKSASPKSFIGGDHWGRSNDIVLELDPIDEPGNYPLTVTVTSVNGSENQDVVPTHVGMVNIMEFVPVHRALVEEYTGTWCGWCTRGLVAMRMLAETFGDDFIGVAYHNSDPMEVTTDYPSNVQGFPSAFVDRYYDVDPYYGYEQVGFGIKDVVEYVMSQLAVVDLNVKAEWADEAKTELKAEVESKFIMNAAKHSLGIEVMLVEDDMYGPAGTEWDQHNYYATMADQYASEPNLGPLCELPEVIEDYHFNDVLVASSGVVPGSLPAMIAANEANTFEYSFYVDYIYNTSYEPVIQNKDKLHVVAIVVDQATGQVLNAAKAKVGSSAVNEISSDNKEIASTIYFDLTGRMVNNPETGIYIKVVRYTDGSQRSFKVFKK